jgi:nucleoside-diphosphate-sugar epimerase
MKVFVTGATGYVGSHVARAFRRAGHEVWGLVRGEGRSAALQRFEIRPVVGTLESPASWRPAAAACSVLVHCASDSGADRWARDRAAVQDLLKACGEGSRPKALLYTSGVWVYGNTGPSPADETSIPSPLPLVAQRPAIEALVTGAAGARGLVLRPGCLYGGSGGEGMTESWFAGALSPEGVTLVGESANKWAMVHADDVGDAYVRAAESGASGEIFNLTDGSRESVREMAEAAARAAGARLPIRFLPVEEARKTMGDFVDALVVDQNVDSRKASALLNWRPRHRGFADEAEIYFAAWQASQKSL